tara:strand:- start:971 stop:1210 length:240 start_codon:yes stop_codon:yes gene_type:complete
MDQLTTELVSLGSNGVIIAAILSAFKVYENRSAKKNGSSGRIESLEKKIDDLCNEFRLFREEVKLRQVREDTLREVSNG